MKKDRKRFRWNERKFKNRETKRSYGGALKHDPLRGSTQAKGIVI
jgi:ribosomal protein S12